MEFRSSLDDIAIVSDQLKFFTLRELFFILQLNEELSALDENKFKRITDCLRYRFGSQQSLQQVKTAILMLQDLFSQTLPLQHRSSLCSILHRRLREPMIVPFSLVCSTCGLSMDCSNGKQRHVKVYWLNGAVSTGISALD
jgi:hypothetical protein